MRYVLTNPTTWEIIAELRVVKIRLRRVGRKHKPIYRVVVADSRSARDGAFIETIGHYNPLTDPSSIDINEEKALKWLNCGAQPTDTVYSLLRKLGIIDKFKQQQILNQN